MITDAMKAEGWIEHDGGECPVDPDVFVFPMFKGEPDPSKGMLRTYGRAGNMRGTMTGPKMTSSPIARRQSHDRDA